MSYYFDISDLVEYAKTNGEVSYPASTSMSLYFATEREKDDIFCGKS